MADDLTIGFKLLSGYYAGGIKKEHIEELPKLNSVRNWGTLDFENKVNQMKTELLKSDLFKFWASWKRSLMSLSSQAVAINFILITLKDWERKGKPSQPSSAEHKQFLRNAAITFDQLVYEYITNQWRGPGDSKVETNLKELVTSKDVFDPMSSEKWETIIKEIITEGKVAGNIYSNSATVDKKIKLLLLYYYTLADISGPDSPVVKDYDFDHIIPKVDIASSSSVSAKNNKSNIFNICILPRRENITKNDRRLDNITEPWLMQQIEKYAEIPQGMFGDFSTVSSMDALKEYRGENIKRVFLTKRAFVTG